ncbi:hypothetical protein BJY14_000404 [Actinomadura luteofluorescens]|uniref:Uncharacterized protein n=1 Tax=Actinomadura luteofluorescens TaxID=46163 RepID=A0A7Y9JDJ1_9ACTN|nr:hypothetical protein [Actinomadura luteofluorescens]NYD44421.1 hypothetical protein [Actinomadura luteofluorescens]
MNIERLNARAGPEAPGSAANSASRTGAAKPIRTRSEERARRPATVAGGDEPALADDGDPVGDGLHLAHDVAGHEHGLPGVAGLGHHLQEHLLHQGVQAGGGLVQDQQFGVVHERLDQADLLQCPGRSRCCPRSG